MCRSCSSPRYPSSGTSGGQALVGTASDPPTNKLSWASLAEETVSDKTMWIKGTPKKTGWRLRTMQQINADYTVGWRSFR